LGIWKIEETEEFFKRNVPQHRDVTHPHKRLQHLAGRFLLQFLYPDFPYELIEIADTRKPYLPDARYHFSISHCGDYAAAIVSSDKRVGVDVELITPRIEQLADKFLHTKEEIFFNEDYLSFLEQWNMEQKVRMEFLTLIWSSKEALFKWHGDGQLDFKANMQLNGNIHFRKDEWLELPFLFSKNGDIKMKVEAKLFHSLVLAFTLSEALAG
jgi:phosphopantetheine--protein transferase-like protein